MTKKLSQSAITTIDTGALHISPIVDLELQYLYEIGRIAAGPEVILPALSKEVGLQISLTSFTEIVVEARTIEWTRDPSNRLITAEVRADQEGIQNLVVDDKEECRNCQWKYWCAGGCPLETYRMTSRYDVKSPRCHIYKALYPQVLRLEGLRLLKYADETE